MAGASPSPTDAKCSSAAASCGQGGQSSSAQSADSPGHLVSSSVERALDGACTSHLAPSGKRSMARAEASDEVSASDVVSGGGCASFSGSRPIGEDPTPPSKVARHAGAPSGNAAPTASRGQQQLPLEFESTEAGTKRYNICGLKFEVTPEYELTRAVGQVRMFLVAST